MVTLRWNGLNHAAWWHLVNLATFRASDLDFYWPCMRYKLIHVRFIKYFENNCNAILRHDVSVACVAFWLTAEVVKPCELLNIHELCGPSPGAVNALCRHKAMIVVVVDGEISIHPSTMCHVSTSVLRSSSLMTLFMRRRLRSKTRRALNCRSTFRPPTTRSLAPSPAGARLATADIDVLCTRSTEVIRKSITASIDNRICVHHERPFTSLNSDPSLSVLHTLPASPSPPVSVAGTDTSAPSPSSSFYLFIKIHNDKRECNMWTWPSMLRALDPINNTLSTLLQAILVGCYNSKITRHSEISYFAPGAQSFFFSAVLVCLPERGTFPSTCRWFCSD